MMAGFDNNEDIDWTNENLSFSQLLELADDRNRLLSFLSQKKNHEKLADFVIGLIQKFKTEQNDKRFFQDRIIKASQDLCQAQAMIDNYIEKEKKRYSNE